MAKKRSIKLFPVAIAQQRWDLAAHLLVIGLVKVQQKDRSKKDSLKNKTPPTGQKGG